MTEAEVEQCDVAVIGGGPGGSTAAALLARRGYRVIEVPCTVRYHAKEGYTKMRGLRDWWRLFRPALLLRTGVKR